MAHTQTSQSNMYDEHGCKNHQQNSSKLNATIHQKDTPKSSGIHSRDGGMAQLLQINQCDTYTTLTKYFFFIYFKYKSLDIHI